jgi:hypothetical protein
MIKISEIHSGSGRCRKNVIKNAQVIQVWMLGLLSHGTRFGRACESCTGRAMNGNEVIAQWLSW